jgi:exo-beta-1,3-glucanase (GH17 family)
MQNSCTREELITDPEMIEKYESEYPAYQPDHTAVESLVSLLKDIQVTVVLGKWCGDSRREEPRFFKILDSVGTQTENIQLICVDHTKSAEDGSTANLQIEQVPTFIFSRNNKEIGRITELPDISLEKDMVNLLTN